MYFYKPSLRLRDLLYLVVLVLALHLTANSQSTENCANCAVPGGMIRGRVLTRRGGVPRGIEIYADRRDQEKGQVPTAEVNDKGFFQLVVPAGRYAVYAGNQALGYPESYGGIYLDAVKPVEITVAHDQVIEVIIKLGPRLRTFSGRIVDSSTGGHVMNAKFRISLVEDPNRYLESAPDLQGRFSVLSPPVPFAVRVQAPGYEKKEITLQPNFSKYLRITLKPRKSIQTSAVRNHPVRYRVNAHRISSLHSP